MRRVLTLLLALALASGALAAPAEAAARADITGLSTHTVAASQPTVVHVYGHYLGQPRYVRVGPTYASLNKIVSTRELVITVPANLRLSRTHIVVYTYSHGHSLWSDPQAVIGVAPAPTLRAVLPNVGPLSGGQTVKGWAYNLNGFRAVYVGGAPASRVTQLGPTTFSFWLPRGYLGSNYIEVLGLYGWSNRIPFQYVDRPTVNNVVEGVGSSAGGVTAQVSGWWPSAPVRSVTVGGVPARILPGGNEFMVNIVVPPHPPGQAHVQVTNVGGTSVPTSADLFTYTRPNPDTWRTVATFAPYRGTMTDASCPTTTFCVALDPFDLYVFSSGRWGEPYQVGGVRAVSCASPAWCLAVGTDQAWQWNGSAWSPTTATEPSYLTDVSCPAADACWAADSAGRTYRWAAGVWTAQAAVAAAVSCASASFCVATTTGETAYTYDGANWTRRTIDPQGSLIDVSCGSPTLCAAIDRAGRVVTWDGSAWSAPVALFAERGNRISCSTTGCAALSVENRVSFFTGHGWATPSPPLTPRGHVPSYLNFSVGALSCAAADSCLVVDAAGHAITYDGSTWSTPQSAFVTVGRPESVSCPTSAWCVMSDALGDVVVGASGTWGEPQRVLDVSGERTAVSCSSPSFCLLVSPTAGDAVFDGVS